MEQSQTRPQSANTSTDLRTGAPQAGRPDSGQRESSAAGPSVSSRTSPVSPALGKAGSSAQPSQPDSRPKGRRRTDDDAGQKRRCVSTACIACRKRKSRCDGNTPSCAACATVYGTACVYDPNSDHRRKGVYKKDTDSLKTRSSTLQTLISAILNYPADEVPDLVRQIRACESLDKVADSIIAKENGEKMDVDSEDSPIQHVDPLSFEHQLSSKVGELRIEDGSLRFIGGTSNLLYTETEHGKDYESDIGESGSIDREEAILSWTGVTDNAEVVMHLLNMYFTWHYSFFTTLSKPLFWRDFFKGRSNMEGKHKTEYCSALLVNAMLALGCHFSFSPAAREDSEEPGTAGDHFFKEAKKLINEGDLYEDAKITTVQALALMSVREAGCGRESKGWVYSGISFRMACDLGLNYESDALSSSQIAGLTAEEVDCRRITFWGCFLFDKCWSNYLGRLPLFQTSNNVTVPKFDVSGHEDSETWCPYTDSGPTKAHSQPARTRAVALQISSLCDISSDLMKFFYHPQEKTSSKQAELTRLGDCHSRLETWRRNLPKEMEPKEGALPSVLVMHMLFQLLYIHLFRPFLKYSPNNSPLPAHVSPRKLCTTAATTISKLLRLYKRSYGLRQICNIAVYIAHSACTIHLLNLPDKNAKRDIAHGVRHLEEIADGWLCARRTLCVLSLQARKWHIDMPDDAAVVLARSDARYGRLGESGRPQDAQLRASQSLLNSNQTRDHAIGSGANSPPREALTRSTYGLPGPDFDNNNSLYDTFMGITPQSATPSGNSDFSPSRPTSDHQVAPNPDLQYQNLLRQQQAWQETAQRNGIPLVAPQSQQQQRAFASRQAQHQSLDMPPPQPYASRVSQNAAQLAQQFEAAPPQPRGISRPASTSSLTSGVPKVERHATAIANMLPQQAVAQQPQSARSANKRKFSAQASDMFGGVEALLREGQDWWVEDQSQVASGFGNWGLSNPSLLSGSVSGTASPDSTRPRASKTSASPSVASGPSARGAWSDQQGEADPTSWGLELGAQLPQGAQRDERDVWYE